MNVYNVSFLTYFGEKTLSVSAPTPQAAELKILSNFVLGAFKILDVCLIKKNEPELSIVPLITENPEYPHILFVDFIQKKLIKKGA